MMNGGGRRQTHARGGRAGWAFRAVLLAAAFGAAGTPARAASSPGEVRVGVVIERRTAEIAPPLAHASGQGWCALLHLAGVPYSTALLEEVLAAGADSALARWDAIVLTACRFVPDERAEKLGGFLEAYRAGGGALIVDGPPAYRNGEKKRRPAGRIEEVLGAVFDGFRGDTRNRIRVERNDHPITRGFAPGEFLTQHLDDGLRILRFRDGGTVLLGSRSGEGTLPFLSVREGGEGGRIALLSEFAASAGTAVSFRNYQPSGFYPNRLYDCLVPLVHWAVYGSAPGPVPALQLVNADAAVLVRLDADQSWNVERQERTVRFLTGMARRSGVSTVYGVVSADAAAAGWERIAPLLREIERFGGRTATHSHHHVLDARLDEEIARSELDSSRMEMESGLRDAGGPRHRIDWFINPNNEIFLIDYGPIAARFPVFLTHGFSQTVPHAYGVTSWFCGEGREMVVINCSSTPDYEWFYADGWEYGVNEITALQESIFDHMLRDVRRGVLFHPMWHDYSINSVSLRTPTWRDRLPRFLGGGTVEEPSHLSYYEGMAARFAASPVYAPRPVELTRKLRVMAECGFSWNSSVDRVDLEIRLAGGDADSLAAAAAGMAVRIENGPARIAAARLNGRPLPAFRDDRVILPALEPGTNRLEIDCGAGPVRGARLVYASHRTPEVRALPKGGVEARVLTRSRARLAFASDHPLLILGADGWSAGPPSGRTARAFVFSDRTVRAIPAGGPAFRFTGGTVPFLEYRESGSDRVEVRLGESACAESRIRFRSAAPVRKILFEGTPVRAERDGEEYRIDLPSAPGGGGVLCVLF